MLPLNNSPDHNKQPVQGFKARTAEWKSIIVPLCHIEKWFYDLDLAAGFRVEFEARPANILLWIFWWNCERERDGERPTKAKNKIAVRQQQQQRRRRRRQQHSFALHPYDSMLALERCRNVFPINITPTVASAAVFLRRKEWTISSISRKETRDLENWEWLKQIVLFVGIVFVVLACNWLVLDEYNQLLSFALSTL